MSTMAFVHPLPLVSYHQRVLSSSLTRPLSARRPRRAAATISTVRAVSSSSPSIPPADDNSADAESSKPDTDGVEESTTEEEAPQSPNDVDPLENAQQQLQSTINNVFNALYAPIKHACPVLSSEWEPAYGNYILYPPASAGRPPKSVIHFLGGAFFGAVPHHLYNSFLVRLAAKGHVIVTTPYNLSFDYLPVADAIASAWECVESDLAFKFGPLPVIGLGHSGGTVFHSLINTLFNDTAPKAANIFISYNNRPASDAIPNYADVVKPIASQSVYFKEEVLPKNISNTLDALPAQIDNFIMNNLFVPTAVKDEILPLSQQNRQFINQISPLLYEIANPSGGSANSTDGSQQPQQQQQQQQQQDIKEFYPPPEDIQKSIQMLYSVNHNLLIKFTNDTLDDTVKLQELFNQNYNQVNSSIVELTGTHLTPLAQDSPDLNKVISNLPFNAPGTETLVSGLSGVLGEVVGSLGARDLNKLEIVIDEWIDAGIASGKF